MDFLFFSLCILTFIKNKQIQCYNGCLNFSECKHFLDRGFRVRSDLLSTSFSLIALLITLNIKGVKDYWKFYIAIPVLLSVILISPKGIYWLLLSSCLVLYELKNKIPSYWFIIKIVFFTFIAFILLSFFFKDPFFFTAIQESFQFYLNNINATWLVISKEGLTNTLSTFSHLTLFIKRNPLLILLILLKIFFIIQATIITKKRKWDLSDLFFLFLIIIFLFHPQQKLFFLCSITPFFILSFFTDSHWKKILNQNYSLQFKSLFLLGAFLYSFSYISFFNYKVYMKKNNQLQKELIGKLNNFYKNTNPSISILDPACIVYKRKTDCKYILNNQDFMDNFETYLSTQDFDLILASKTLDIFKLTQYEESSIRYINISHHIYYKAFIIDLNNQKFFAKTTNLKKNNPVLASSTLIKKKRQKKFSGQNKNQNPKKTLSGKSIIQSLNSSLETNISEKSLNSNLKRKTPKQSRKYSYLFLDSKNKIIKNQLNPEDKKTKDCYENNVILKSGCLYSKEEFEEAFIQINSIQTEKRKIALFYIPFPTNLSKNLSLRALFRYDMFE